MTDRYHFRPAERHVPGALLRPLQHALASHRPCYVWQAERFGLVVGVIAWQREPRSQTVATLAIHVDPTCRGQGVGHFLLDQVLQVARDSGLRNLLVRVPREQSVALALFTKFGFVPVLESPVSDGGEACIWLSRALLEQREPAPHSLAA